MNKVFFGDCRETMKRLIAEGVKVQTCVTSPPYWGLRDYGHEPTIWGGDPLCNHEWNVHRYYTQNSAGKCGAEAFSEPGEANAQRLKAARWRNNSVCVKCGAWLGCFGLEPTPKQFVDHAVEVFSLVRDLLSDDGTLWLNLGDSYAAGGRGASEHLLKKMGAKTAAAQALGRKVPTEGLKPKDLVGIPWRVAFALQSAGWYLRSDIIWHKPNPMPESVTDRPTKAHEYIFLLSKQERYYYNAEAVREPAAEASLAGWMQDVEQQEGSARAVGKSNGKMKAVGGPYKKDKQRGHGRRHDGFNDRWDHMTKAEQASMGRNKRSVWTVATMPFSGAHFATFPPALIEPCILAGSRPGDIVFDPFIGSGTTGQVAEQLGRQWIGCEIQGEYEPLQKQRTAQTGMIL